LLCCNAVAFPIPLFPPIINAVFMIVIFKNLY
jgi:hypothetical protein